MTIRTSIIGLLLSLFLLGNAVGQTFIERTPRLSRADDLETPPPPPSPPEDISASSIQLDEFVPEVPASVRTIGSAVRPADKTPGNREAIPTDRELVSILKRNLPQSNQTIEMRDAPEWFQTMMQRIVRENVPDKYVQDKDWGKTDKRWDGIAIRRKGPLKLSTKRRWKEVNHGTWKRYEITQRNPDENLLLKIENVHDAGKGNVGFEVELASKLHAHGRFAKWAKGIQVYNLSADADAAVVMRLWCKVGMKLDISKFPPDVLLVPNVTKANMQLTDFQLQSVSKLDGPLVKNLSGNVHKLLLSKIAEKRADLPKKINKQIAKNKDKMRLSMADFASSKWSALTGAPGSRNEDSPTGAAGDTSARRSVETRVATAKPGATSSEIFDMQATTNLNELQLNSATAQPLAEEDSLRGGDEIDGPKLINLLGPRDSADNN